MTEYKKEAPELNILHSEDDYTIEDLLGAIIYNTNSLSDLVCMAERNRIIHCARRVWDLVPEKGCENSQDPSGDHWFGIDGKDKCSWCLQEPKND